jgi:2-(1,2-epoxy-1,2-dihydrophenyl)acetyl-CoA isomerase
MSMAVLFWGMRPAIFQERGRAEMNKLVSSENGAGVCLIRLNDPKSLNSLSENLARQLFDALKIAEEDTKIRCVVIVGSGDAFCAGGNLKDFAGINTGLDKYVNKVMAELYNPLAKFLYDRKTPLITAVNGPAIGAGVGLALNADFVLMAQGSYFSLPFVPRLALLPDFGTTWLLARALGYNRALGYVLTGNKIDAEMAQADGLAWRVVSKGELVQAAMDLAGQMVRVSPVAVDAAREALRRTHDNALKEQLELERELQTQRFGSAAFQEGLDAFVGKRSPDFMRVLD